MTLTNSTTLATRAHDGGVHDDTDPAAPPTRRSYSPEYKLAILTAYDEETEPGAKGAFLRREGLYSSQITEWRKAREAGSAGRPRGEPANQAQRRAQRSRPAEAEKRTPRVRAGQDTNGARHRGKSTRALGDALRERGHRGEVDEVIDTHHSDLSAVIGKKAACRLLGRARATHYRRCTPRTATTPQTRPTPPNALSETERQAVFDLLHAPRTHRSGRRPGLEPDPR